MSDQLPDICAVDYTEETVDINIEVIIAACGGAVTNEVLSVKWTFHKMKQDNDYKIDTANTHKVITTQEPNLQWTGLGDDDLSIYAVEVELELQDFKNKLTIMGYLVIGCGESVQVYAKGKCESVYDDVKMLAGIKETKIYNLRKCDGFVSSYKATSTKQYDLEAIYEDNDIYSANSPLQVYTTISFQVKCESDAYVLLHEEKTDEIDNIVEVVIGDEGVSIIRTERNKIQTDHKLKHMEASIVSDEEFRYFWISFAGNEVRVGKGGIPYVDQFLMYDKLNHDINYVSFGNGQGVSGAWKFDIIGNRQLLGGSRLCLETYWGFNKESSTCEETCDGQNNCFQTKDLCQQSCDVLTPVTNCKKLQLEANGGLSNGTYSITNHNGEAFTVYCQFYSGYGYTFVSKKTNVDIDIMSLYDDRTQVIIRHQRSNGNQYTSTMEQLSSHSSSPILVQYNGHTGYREPINKAMTPYIYVGFVPASSIYSGAKVGWKCNGNERVFTNCDENANSYIVFLFNQGSTSYIGSTGGYKPLTFCWYDSAIDVPSSEYLPDEFFTPYFEVHHGGCGDYGRGDSEPDIAGATVGLKFVISCATPSDISYGTKFYTETVIGSVVTYSCDSGYVVLSGDAERTCTDTGGWSGTLPICGENCNAGQYYDSGQLKCEPCPVGQYQNQAKQTECITCPDGTTTMETGSINSNKCIENCNAGQYYDSGQLKCEPCPIGQYQDQAKQTKCMTCPDGTTTMETGSINSNKCIENCNAGQYYDSGQLKCEPCPIGQYQDQAKQTECMTCPDGTTTMETGSINSNKCIENCNAGQYYDSGQLKCEPCPVGQYQDQAKQTECITCPDGTTTTKTGSINRNKCIENCDAGHYYDSGQLKCEPCPVGQYQDQAKQTECITCPYGTTTLETGSINSNKCIANCQAGQFFNNVSGKCESCPPNTFQSEPYRYECENCPADTFVATTGADDISDCKGKNRASPDFPTFYHNDLFINELSLLHLKKNPYVWDRSAAEVNMEVLSVDLTSGDTEVTVTNLSQPLKVTLEAPEADKPPNSTLLLHLIKSGSGLTYSPSMPNILNLNFTVPEGKTTILSLFSFFQIRNFKIYIDEYENPTLEKVTEFGVSYPDQVAELSKNFSKFELTKERPDNSSQILLTYNKSMSLNYTGTYFLGVTLDLQNESTVGDLQDLDAECIGNDTVTECVTEIDVKLQVDTRTLDCTYWDKPSQTWSGQGCEVSPFSTKEKLECLCTHFTAFSGGVFVLPNFVDPIGDAALFLTFFDNPVVVTAVIVIWILYFFLIHWARQSDRKDQEQIGVTALGDTDRVNKYMYIVCVVTGWWTGAGTTANVFFYMKGKAASSKKIKLTTSARLCFQSGYEDWFLVTTEENLGDLQHVTLWHDNSGTSPHWYLSQVFVKDLKRKKSWTFICNDWLAVDRGSALLTTTCIPAITKEEMKLKQKHNFMVKTTQDLRDSHLWLSIFSKPARSTFTRVQRVTCALSLLLTTMLTNIMFYGVPTDDPDDQIGGSRGLVISLSSIVIGIQSSLLMFPVNVIIMQMFLKLKQRPEKVHVNKKRQSFVQSLYDSISHITIDVLLKLAAREPPSEYTKEEMCEPDTGDVHVKVAMSTSPDIVINGETRNTPENIRSDMQNTRQQSSEKNVTASFDSKSSKVIILSDTNQTGKILPWWFLYISWFLVLSVSLVCSYFVMLYGLKYGYLRSVEWLVAFLTGFSQSALVTQPLKVLAVAMVITLIFKRTVEFDDYGPEVRLDEDTTFVNSVNKTEDTRIPYSQPLSTNLLQKIKAQLQLKWMMDITLRDIVLYIIYMAVVCIVVHGHRDIKEAYYNSVAIEDVLVNPGCIVLYQCFFLAKVDSVHSFYKFMYEVAIPNLADMSIADHEYATPGSSHFLVGPWRLRQLRVDRGTCGKGADELFRSFGMNVQGCTGSYWLGDEEKRHFGNSWSEVHTEPSNPPTRWTYQSAWKLKTIPFKGNLATYSGGGYIITMPSNSSLHEGIVGNMWNSDWIDERTRAIFLEFTLYNPNADLFSVVIILFEFSNNGVIVPYHQIFSTRLYHYSTGFANFVLACECLFLVFNISFTYTEWKKFGVLGRKKYFEDYWSYIEIIQVALSFSVVGLFFQRIVSVNSVMKDFRASDGDEFISFYTAISWDFILGYVMAFLVALVTLKAIKLLKFNKRTYMVADTIAHSKSSIASFMALAVIVAIAFGHFATLAFGRLMDNYRDMLTSLVTVFNFSLGVADFDSLQEANRILGPVYFCIFVFVITFIFLTVFVAILNFGINESKVLFEKRQNKFELFEYVKTKLKLVLKSETSLNG